MPRAKKVANSNKNILLIILLLTLSILSLLIYSVGINRLGRESMGYKSEASTDAGGYMSEQSCTLILQQQSDYCYAEINGCTQLASGIATNCRGKGVYNHFSITCHKKSGTEVRSQDNCSMYLKGENDSCISTERAAYLAQKLCCDEQVERFKCNSSNSIITLDQKAIDRINRMPEPTLHPCSRTFGIFMDSCE